MIGFFSILCIVLFCFLPSGIAGESPNDGPGTFDGLIEPYQVVKVGSPVVGVLDTVPVERGDLVKKGQVIARLKADVEQASLELAKVRAEMEAEVAGKRLEIEFSRREEQRIKTLFKQMAISEKQLDEVETKRILAEFRLSEALENRRLAQAELKRADAVLRRMTILSPVTGVVVERYMSSGEYIENQPVLHLAQIDPLHVETILPAKMWGKIKVGMSAVVRPEEPLVGTFAAKVTIVDRVIDAASATFGVRLEMPNPNNLPPGSRCTVTFANQPAGK